MQSPAPENPPALAGGVVVVCVLGGGGGIVLVFPFLLFPFTLPVEM